MLFKSSAAYEYDALLYQKQMGSHPPDQSDQLRRPSPLATSDASILVIFQHEIPFSTKLHEMSMGPFILGQNAE